MSTNYKFTYSLQVVSRYTAVGQTLPTTIQRLFPFPYFNNRIPLFIELKLYISTCSVKENLNMEDIRSVIFYYDEFSVIECLISLTLKCQKVLHLDDR